MAFKKKATPKPVVKVFNRIDVMKSIDTEKGKPVVYGVATPVTTASLGAKQTLYEGYLDSYNLALSTADSLSKKLDDLKKDILNDNEIVTTSAASIFGLEGIELVQLGLKRKKDRKPRKTKKSDAGDPSTGK